MDPRERLPQHDRIPGAPVVRVTRPPRGEGLKWVVGALIVVIPTVLGVQTQLETLRGATVAQALVIEHFLPQFVIGLLLATTLEQVARLRSQNGPEAERQFEDALRRERLRAERNERLRRRDLLEFERKIHELESRQDMTNALDAAAPPRSSHPEPKNHA